MSDRRYQSRDDRQPPRHRDDRRRSRSPRGGAPPSRGGGYGDRREPRRDDGRGAARDGGVDSYASDRGYRDRVREERYGGGRAGDWRSGGDGGRDRGDRDRRDPHRGGRRDGHRDDDRRRERRDDRRDDYGARDGPRDGGRDQGRNTRGDRDDMAEMDAQQRRGARSASPEQRKVKEPTPDLTEVESVLERQRRRAQWDIKPQGYDNVTAEQAKLSGMFPLPGAPRQQAVDPSRLQAFMNQPGNAAGSTALKPATARQSKRLFVYNIPQGARDDTISGFFNLQLNGLNVTKGTDPCTSAQISKDGSYALIEMKTAEDATNALALDGQTMEDSTNGADDSMNGGQGLSIKRPKDYIVPTLAPEGDDSNGLLGDTLAPEGPDKILVTNLGVQFEETQVRELLETFGELKHFVLAKETGGNLESRGWALCDYSSPAMTDPAIENLNGIEIQDRVISFKRACVGVKQTLVGPGGAEMSVGAMSLMAGTTSKEVQGGRVLCLMNMITVEELMDSEEADEILLDVREECAKYGPLLDVKMPRPTTGNRSNAGLGKIYLAYGDAASAAKALAALAGRKFADRTVVGTFFDEQSFELGAW